ncbi:DUF1146 family protein [Gorillibacterium massiliense]|uniref:DUF1146 family protein n=1 Tax=Gorillibacterium massiliense TaxID=1280390 RepID=UPI0004B4019E|nr:DUF1146 family protein [Gorillibacterium massiliense]
MTDNTLAQSMAISGLGSILITLVCITLAWLCLQQFRFDLFLKQPKSPMAKLLQIFLSIVLGYELGRFLMDYFSWSQLLPGLF